MQVVLQRLKHFCSRYFFHPNTFVSLSLELFLVSLQRIGVVFQNSLLLVFQNSLLLPLLTRVDQKPAAQ